MERRALTQSWRSLTVGEIDSRRLHPWASFRLLKTQEQSWGETPGHGMSQSRVTALTSRMIGANSTNGPSLDG